MNDILLQINSQPEMKLSSFAAAILMCGLLEDAFGQTVEVVTYTSAENQRLQCNISGSGAVQWIDRSRDPFVPIISYIPSTGSETLESTDEKYDNFAFEALESIYNLIINNVERDDDGSYGCTLTPGGIAAAYRVIVEVPTDSISLSCSSCTEANSACDCQCLASGGFSPSLLRLEWKINDIALPIQPPTVNSTDSGQTTYSSDAVVTVEQDDSVVTCTVTEFENQDDIARQFPSALVAEQTLSSPDCIVSVNDVNCPTVVLSCSCEAYPIVPDGPEYISYYARQGPEDTGNDTLLPSPSYDTTAGSDTYFICSGDNGLSFGRKSEAISNPCKEEIRTLPPATTDTMSGDGCHQRSSPALIAVCCVEGVVIIVIIFVFGFLYTIRKGSRKEAAQSLETHPYNRTDNTNTGYMDLQETKQLSSNHANVDIPFENISLQSPFPGKGLMKYRKAQMTLTSTKEEIVVKTTSDDAPVRLAKLQADEVRKLATLASNVNVAQYLGRCNNVPNLLCYQFVNGTKLGEYLRENFQRSKTHQYGNTKQKHYHVPAKGSVESLPRVPLQIARGMKYLASKKFLHPGLRSEKVIIDVSGQCKLYDFVSEDNAKDIIAISWSKAVPYQWMPPEYLFLEKLGPSVDVWSFGVLLWEIFSYGALPHEGKGRNDVEKELRGRENLPMPSNCPGAIWQITLNCWDQSPEKRPSFDHLTLQLSHMCNDNKEYDEIPSK